MIRDDETVKPWYTETAKVLVKGILADQAWDRLPILADALEENGCDDTNLLYSLRQGDWENNRKPQADQWFDRLIAGVVTVYQIEEACLWMEEFSRHFYGGYNRNADDLRTEAESQNVSGVEWVMEVCADRVKNSDNYFLCSGYDTPSEVNVASMELMWKHYEVLTGTPPVYENYSWRTTPKEYPATPFFCSC